MENLSHEKNVRSHESASQRPNSWVLGNLRKTGNFLFSKTASGCGICLLTSSPADGSKACRTILRCAKILHENRRGNFLTRRAHDNSNKIFVPASLASTAGGGCIFSKNLLKLGKKRLL